MKECCRREENWKSRGGKSLLDYDSAAYVRKTTKTYVECMSCGSKLMMETTRIVSDRLEKKPRRAEKRPHAAGTKTLPA